MLIAEHLAALPNGARRIRSAAEVRAPFLSVAELRDVIEAATAVASAERRKWSADRLAWRLRLTDAERQALGIRTIGAVDLTREERRQRRKDRDREASAQRRRQSGAKDRATYLAEQAATPRPWVELGISKATWYRRKRT